MYNKKRIKKVLHARVLVTCSVPQQFPHYIPVLSTFQLDLYVSGEKAFKLLTCFTRLLSSYSTSGSYRAIVSQGSGHQYLEVSTELIVCIREILCLCLQHRPSLTYLWWRALVCVIYQQWGKELSTFTQVLYLSTILRYFYFTWVFPLYATLHLHYISAS